MNNPQQDFESSDVLISTPSEEPEARDLSRIESFPDAGRPLGAIQQSTFTWDKIYYPFEDKDDFQLANWFIEYKVSKTAIDKYFGIRKNMTFKGSFSSAYGLWKQIDVMADGLDIDFQTFKHDFKIPGRPPVEYLFRDPVKCVEHLLRQIAYERSLVYAPIKQYNSEGNRYYTEMHTADWWWQEQEKLPIGGTLIPIICASDSAQLTGYSGDKKVWPIYLTIGNLPSTIRNKPSFGAFLTLALLPIPPKKKGLSPQEKDSIIRDIQEIIYKILSPLQDSWNPKPNEYDNGIEMLCADGFVRKCYLRLSGWIADHVEYCELLNISGRSCPVCEVDVDRLGTYVPDAVIRDYHLYEGIKSQLQQTTLSREQRKLLLERLHCHKSHQTPLAFCQLPGIRPSMLPKPDLLHGIYLGTLKNILIWTTDFLRDHKKLKEFDEAWTSLPSYPRFSKFKLAFSQITQWQGKELRAAGRILLCCLTVALSQPMDRTRPSVFDKVITCVRAFLEFHLLVQYKSHDEQTIRYTEDFWELFHKTKEVFSEFRNRGLKKRLLQNHKEKKLVAEKEVADMTRLTVRQRKDVLDNRLRELEVAYDEKYAKLDTFNTVKMHQPSHFTDSIRLFGHLNGWSTDAPELAHRFLKEGYRASNRVDFNPQILAYQTRHYLFRLRRLNILTLAEKSEQDASESEVDLSDLISDNAQEAQEAQSDSDIEEDEISDDEEQASSSQPQPTASLNLILDRRKLKGRRPRSKGQGPWKVSDIRDIYNLPDLPQHLYDYFRSHWLSAVSSGRLSSFPGPTQALVEDLISRSGCQPFNQLQVQVPDFIDPTENVIHAIRCTGPFPWRKQPPRNDFIFIDKSGPRGGQYGSLYGRMPSRVECILRVTDPYLQETHDVLLITEFCPLNNGYVQDPHGLVKVMTRRGFEEPYPDSGRWPDRRIIHKDKAISLAHLVRIRQSTSYYINSHVDLDIYNTIY